MTDHVKLTVQELEGSGYNEAAQHVLRDDQLAAARNVLSHDGPYDDRENHRIRKLARAILAEAAR